MAGGGSVDLVSFCHANMTGWSSVDIVSSRMSVWTIKDVGMNQTDIFMPHPSIIDQQLPRLTYVHDTGPYGHL